MTIIVFLLDTSASMNQRVFLGGRPTLLDVAKSAVETFVKVRQRSLDSRQDRYMLLTFEEPPSNIKAGWKENLATFMSELKNLQANGLTTLGHALRHTFDVLNVNRMQHGIDTYGQGRCPFYLEPSIIVAITDGGKLSSNSGVQEELKMHGTSPGFELTREPFRWDQRLFSLVLRMSGQPAGDREIGLVPSDSSPIDAMCEVTGGRSYCITTHRMLHQCIDSLVQKVQAGVVIHFEKVGLDPPPLINNLEGKSEEDDLDEKNDAQKLAWHNCRKMIYVPRTNQKGFAGGFWPIPEAFWPDPSIPALPPRTAHPHVKFTCVAQEPLVVENFPFDKYELEPSPLTQYILARKQPTVCWQAYMSNSSKNGQLSHPFGYLKASTNLTCVNLFVMPHNYPILLPLLDDLFRVYRLKPSNEWKAQFGMYLSQMPGYYAGPLKRALIRMGAGNIAQSITEETYLSFSVLNYLKKLKTQAKIEYEKTCNEVGARVKLSETKRIVTSYKNPFDVPRHQLLEHLAKLRTHFLRPTPFSDLQQDNIHSMPVGQMGNYQEYLKRQPTPLREIESTPVRQHMFGNPFKIDKRMIIDEADIDFTVQNGGKISKKEQQFQGQMPPVAPAPIMQPVLSRGMKRKPGPLPLDFNFTPKRSRNWPTVSPTASPPLSPTRPPLSLNIPPATPSIENEVISVPTPPPAWKDDDLTIIEEKKPAAKEEVKKVTPEIPTVTIPDVEDKDLGYRSTNSFLSESMTLALWTDEDFQDRETDDDLKEELPDVGMEDDLSVDDQAPLVIAIDDVPPENAKSENPVNPLNGLPVVTVAPPTPVDPVVPPLSTPPPSVVAVVTPTPAPPIVVPVNGEASKENILISVDNNQMPNSNNYSDDTIAIVNVKTNGLPKKTKNNVLTTTTTTTTTTIPTATTASEDTNHVTTTTTAAATKTTPATTVTATTTMTTNTSSKSSKKKVNHVNSNNSSNSNSNKLSKKQPASPASPSSTIKKVKKEKTNNNKVPMQVTLLDEECIRKQNLLLRTELFKEIRRPIFRMDMFLGKLTEISGSEPIKIEFLKSLEKEAVRFKRKRVADMLARQLVG